MAILSGDTGDGGLMTLMTDGVYIDVAPSGKTKFVIVSLVIAQDDYVFEGQAWERSLYLVKAVELNPSGTTVKTAAARIHELLQDIPLTITGFTHMLTRRAERVRYTEVDPDDQDIRWQHRGGRYNIFVSPA